MERWSGKVAIVTGAGSGIGKAIAKIFAKHDLKVVAVDKNQDRLEKLVEEAGGVYQKGGIFPFTLDLTNINLIPQLFKEVREHYGGVDVMVNCAGVANNLHYLMDLPTSTIKELVEVNLMAYVVNAREAIKDMKDRNFAGHIFNINSVAGHRLILNKIINYNLYPATKFATTAVCDTTRYELALKGTNIRITSISPGQVNTNIFKDGHYDDYISKLDKTKILEPEDVAQTLVYALSLPQRVLVSELTVMHTLDLI